MNLVESYFPLPSELSPEILQAARERMAFYLTQTQPTLDMRPGSVFGDRALTPSAQLLAAVEIAVERVLQDLSLEGVARGVVYDCATVKTYLMGLGFGTDERPVRGHVRLSFIDPTPQTLDRSLQFTFGGDSVFFPTVNSIDGQITLMAQGTATGPDAYDLVQGPDDTWQAVIPINGRTGATISEGEEAATNFEVSNLARVESVTALAARPENESVVAAAQRARQFFTSPGFGTRAAIESAIARRFADISSVRVLAGNDPELLRAQIVGGAWRTPAVDVLVRHARPPVVHTQRVRLEYDVDSDTFFGRWYPASPPLSVTAMRIPSEDHTLTLGADFSVVMQSSAPTRAPNLSAGLTGLEEFAIRVPMPYVSGDPVYVPETELPSGDRYGVFELSYLIQPELDEVSRHFSTPENQAAGLDVLVRPYTPMLVSKLEVRYVRDAGVNVATQQAAEEILSYFARLAGESRFSPAAIYDIMRYAGARDVRAVQFTGVVHWSAATHFLPEEFNLDSLDDLTGESLLAPTVTVTNEVDVNIDFSDPDFTADGSWAAVSPRTQGFTLFADNIEFREILA